MSLNDDLIGMLNFQFKNSRGFFKTANLETIYHRHVNTSNLHALWVRVLMDYVIYWNTPGARHRVAHLALRYPNTPRTHWCHAKMLEYIRDTVNYCHDLDPDNNADCDNAKGQIEMIIRKYHELFTPIPLINYPTIVNLPIHTLKLPKRDAYEKYYEYSYKKGHRGIYKSTYLKPYSVWVPEVLPY